MLMPVIPICSKTLQGTVLGKLASHTFDREDVARAVFRHVFGAAIGTVAVIV